MYPSPQNRMILSKKFSEIKQIENKQDRGYKFEELVFDLFRFYGLQPIRDQGKTKSGDQIDIIANFEGKHLLIETRYSKDTTDRTAIEKINGKMNIRQPNTIGIYFSMSGFTDDAIKFVNQIINERIIILIDEIEIENLFSDYTQDFEVLLRKKIFYQTKDSEVTFDIKEEINEINLTSVDYHDIVINKNNVEYLSSTTNTIGCITFSPIYYGLHKTNYFIELYYSHIHLNKLMFILKKFEDIFGFTEKSAFCINQTNYLWYGLGIKSFLNALEKKEERYKQMGNNRIHHSEAVVFVDELPGRNGGVFTLSLQPSNVRKMISHVSISFLLYEIPFPKSRYEILFDSLKYKPESIQVINKKAEMILRFESDVPIKKVGYLKLKNEFLPTDHDEQWSDGIIIENPFKTYNVETIEEEDYIWDYDNFMKMLKSLNNIILFLPNHETMDSHSKYKLREVRLLHLPTSGFSSVCVNPIGQWFNE